MSRSSTRSTTEGGAPQAVGSLVVVGVIITLWVMLAPSHSGFPAQAPFAAPSEACVAHDESVPVRWTDSDSETPFGPAFIDVFATREDLLTFDVGQTPVLRGPVIASRVPEPDTTNAFEWRTATVAAGHYHLWTIVREPPQEVASVQITERTPQVVTIVHPSARVGPSVAVTRPRTALATSRGAYELQYAACDPTGTGRVTIDVAPRGGAFERLASDLPAVPNGALEWSTAGLEPGTWTVRATVADDCGGYYVGYGRYYVDVIDEPDAGPRDVSEAPPIDARVVAGARCEERWRRPGEDSGLHPDAARDAGTVGADVSRNEDAGPAVGAEVDAPASCAATSAPELTPLLGLAALLALRRGPRRSGGAPCRAASARRPA